MFWIFLLTEFFFPNRASATLRAFALDSLLGWLAAHRARSWSFCIGDARGRPSIWAKTASPNVIRRACSDHCFPAAFLSTAASTAPCRLQSIGRVAPKMNGWSLPSMLQSRRVAASASVRAV